MSRNPQSRNLHIRDPQSRNLHIRDPHIRNPTEPQPVRVRSEGPLE